MDDGPAAKESRSHLVRGVVAFGAFWWEFLIGDTPELFVGAVGVVAVVAAICINSSARSAAAWVLTALVLALLGISVWKASGSQ